MSIDELSLTGKILLSLATIAASTAGAGLGVLFFYWLTR